MLFRSNGGGFEESGKYEKGNIQLGNPGQMLGDEIGARYRRFKGEGVCVCVCVCVCVGGGIVVYVIIFGFTEGVKVS